MELLPNTRKNLLSARGRCTLACVSSVSIARRLHKLTAGTIRYSKGAKQVMKYCWKKSMKAQTMNELGHCLQDKD